MMRTKILLSLLGGSVTKDFLPGEYQSSYGGNPLTAKVFMQLGGMKMWDL